eukprot:TRINITY_DN6316_c0_g3_i1.p1 TRINITY_DN6316_c0_g3~~TRINITY_DN6316_c0_g3_i1.p1  ORF type:complete len:118 (-),score=19.67 TRINITY_DN6316_c0_g3_i1:53-406(-)
MQVNFQNLQKKINLISFNKPYLKFKKTTFTSFSHFSSFKQNSSFYKKNYLFNKNESLKINFRFNRFIFTKGNGEFVNETENENENNNFESDKTSIFSKEITNTSLLLYYYLNKPKNN